MMIENDGILIINKPKGVTSRDVVNKVSKMLNIKKIGHTGTLDPLATGVLILTVGKATKLSEIITCEEKTYEAEAILGLKTDTFDITGKILEEHDNNYKFVEVEKVVNSFLGSYEQEVPIYSAVKINGKKLYEYARNNESVDLPKRLVTIKKIELNEVNYVDNKTKIKFTCTVSKGTYIRSLINDIANKLNTFGTMTDLKRLKQGNYDISEASNIDKINFDNIISIEDVLKDYYTVDVDDDLKFKIKNGQVLDNLYNEKYVVFKDKKVLAIYKLIDNKLKPFKMFL